MAATLRVDIPRWPDWIKNLKVSVVPSGRTVDEEPHLTPSGAAEVSGPTEALTAEGEITFAETAGHLWEVRNDRSQSELLADAVTGLSFALEADIERRLLYVGDNAPTGHRDGVAVWAHYPEPPLPLVLFVPKPLAADFEQLHNGRWRGRATVVGWDSQHRRLQLQLDP